MESFDVQVKLRTEVGKNSTKNIRKQGFVPCEMYGGEENVHFCVEEKLFQKLVYTPNVYIINLDIEGKKHRAIIHNMQFHPVTDQLLHVDFIEIFEDKKVAMKIPVRVTGNSIGIRNGGKLRLVRRALKVSAFPKDLLNTLDIDITDLEIGDTIKIKDLSYNNVELIGPPNAMVVGVVSSRISKSMMIEEEVAVGEEAEGEEGEEAAEGAETKEGAKEPAKEGAGTEAQAAEPKE